MFQEFLKTKSSKEIEIKQLLSDSENKLPEIECGKLMIYHIL